MALEASKTAMQTVGDYDLVEKIAEGGMGTVYKGRHRTTGEIVAVKVVSPNMMSNQVLLKRFENEFRAASKLNHPNIVRALDYGSVSGRPYLVMEFVEGESLGEKIERDGRLKEDEAIRIISLAAQGLEQAHSQGLIHRDVKPDNIMVTKDGQVKMADLGLVKEVEADLNLTRTGRGLGTPHFMSPEQFRNAKNADIRCDIYSMGATLYMMVTGELPFKSCGPLDAWMKKVHNEIAPARKLVPTLSVHVDAAIQRSMNADPNVRQATCQEFIADLTGKSVPKAPAPSKDGPATNDLWYLVYKDETGKAHTVKGSTSGIRRSLGEGLLGDAGNIRVCRTKTGTFEPLNIHGEFRDLLPGATRQAGVPTPTHIPSVPTSAGLSTAPMQKKTDPAGNQDAPHIPLETKHSQLVEVLTMVLLTVVAMAIGMGIFYFVMKR